jgi:hypothetical protein
MTRLSRSGLVYLRRDPRDETIWQRLVAPVFDLAGRAGLVAARAAIPDRELHAGASPLLTVLPPFHRKV